MEATLRLPKSGMKSVRTIGFIVDSLVLGVAQPTGFKPLLVELFIFPYSFTKAQKM